MQASLARSHPLIVGAALAIILLCVAGAAAITGLIPGAVLPGGDTAPARAGAPGCAGCGTVVAIQRMSPSSAWRITLRMDDGTYRTLSQPEPPALAVGEIVRITGGRALPANQ